MLRILLIVAVALAAALYFPRSRAVVIDVAGPVLNPMLAMSTSAEMEKIAREVQTYERTTGRVPEPRNFQSWLEGRYAGDAMKDSWGNDYTLKVDRQQIEIISPGPDGRIGNDDDISVQAVIR